MVLITEKDISTTYYHFNMKHVETQLQDQEYELLKAFKEKNGLKTDYQGLKELVKALDIPEFHEEIKTEEKKEVKTEVKPIDRTNLENWVRDLSFEQKARGKPQLKTNGMQGNYYRYELASLERLESALLGMDYDLPSKPTEANWIKCLREMFVYFEKVGNTK